MLRVRVHGQTVAVPRGSCVTVRDVKVRSVIQAMGCDDGRRDEEDPIADLERTVEAAKEQLAALKQTLRDLTIVAAVQMHDAV